MLGVAPLTAAPVVAILGHALDDVSGENV